MCLNLAKIGLSIINRGVLSLKASEAKLLVHFNKLLQRSLRHKPVCKCNFRYLSYGNSRSKVILDDVI